MATSPIQQFSELVPQVISEIGDLTTSLEKTMLLAALITEASKQNQDNFIRADFKKEICDLTSTKFTSYQQIRTRLETFQVPPENREVSCQDMQRIVKYLMRTLDSTFKKCEAATKKLKEKCISSDQTPLKPSPASQDLLKLLGNYGFTIGLQTRLATMYNSLNEISDKRSWYKIRPHFDDAVNQGAQGTASLNAISDESLGLTEKWGTRCALVKYLAHAIIPIVEHCSSDNGKLQQFTSPENPGYFSGKAHLTTYKPQQDFTGLAISRASTPASSPNRSSNSHTPPKNYTPPNDEEDEDFVLVKSSISPPLLGSRAPSSSGNSSNRSSTPARIAPLAGTFGRLSALGSALASPLFSSPENPDAKDKD